MYRSYRSIGVDGGVAALGKAALTTPPGTEAIGRIIEMAGGSALILMDEVLNFMNRHRGMAESFYAFLQNLTVAVTGTQRSVVMVSLPRSQVEMTDSDLQWQDKITKVVRRVAKDLIANDESEIGEVVRRRLFEDVGSDRIRRRVAKAFADWCFERRAQLPPEWTAVDTASTEAGAREYLQGRFESCFPLHPATLSVFQRKWQTPPQYQQTRGTLAMLAQWISWAYRVAFTQARTEPLITLGSAPLDVLEFRGVVLGQLGESRLTAAIEADIAGAQSHAQALDADTKGRLRNIHRRAGTAILFESSGGQADKVAHLPELRFALGEPDVDTTSIDNAALALESKAYSIRRVGSDGFRIHHQPTLKKVVSDRRASLDLDSEVRPTMRTLVKTEFERGRTLSMSPFPTDSGAVPDTPKLTLVLLDPNEEWGSTGLRERIAEWTKQRGTSNRLYPGALIWCVKKPGRELQERVEAWLAWKRVKKEIDDGTLPGEFERSELAEIDAEVRDAEKEAKEEVWASYRFIALADSQEESGLRTIDLGAGHASAGETTLSGRIVAALKSNTLLNESPGAGYLERRWPNAFKESEAWPLISLRQAFLTGAMDRLLDPDDYLRRRIPDFVERGEFGLASGQKPDGTYEHVWYKEVLSSDEIAFEADVYLVKKTTAQELKSGAMPAAKTGPLPPLQPPAQPPVKQPEGGSAVPPAARPRQLRLFGDVPPETWNRLGTKLIPKLRSGQDLKVEVADLVNAWATADAHPGEREDAIRQNQEAGVERKTIFQAAMLAALIAFVCTILMGFVFTAPEPGLSLQPSMDVRSASDFVRPTNQYPALALRFFAADTLFVLSYLMVFVGLYTVVAERSRTFAAIGLGAGILAALFDAIENAFFITYALSALNGVPVTDPSLPLIFIVANLKWMGAFGALYAFGLVWPRDTRLGRVVSILMVLFPLVGALGVAVPGLVLVRGLFFLIGMPLFAWTFRQQARTA